MLTFCSSASMPGSIMMMDTTVPRSRKKEKTSRVMVELLEEGQQPHSRHGAEPHRHEAYSQSPQADRRGQGQGTPDRRNQRKDEAARDTWVRIEMEGKDRKEEGHRDKQRHRDRKGRERRDHGGKAYVRARGLIFIASQHLTLVPL